MKLRAVRVCDVRGFAAPGKAIESIGDGLNVLVAENEFGKSTLFDALRVVLFEKHTSNKIAIESLRPYQATGGPMIEVDLEIDGRTYRLRKRFLNRRLASVIDVARGQTIARGDDVYNWIFKALGSEKPEDGPTGLLWVEQDQSLAPPEATEKSGAILNSLLESAVSDVTGGARLRAVLGKAKGERAKLVTEGKKTPKGDYRAALSAQDAAEKLLGALEVRLKELEAKRARLTDIQRELAPLTDAEAVKSRQAALTRVRDKLAAVKPTRERLEGLQNEVRLGKQAVAAKQAAISTFQKTRDGVQANQKKSTELLESRERFAGELETKQSAWADLDVAMKQQEEAVARAKATFAAVQDAEKARALQARLQAFDTQIANAEACEERLAASLSIQDRIAIDRKDLEQLDALSRTRDRAEAALKAHSTTVSVQYHKDTANKVRLKGTPLADQHRVPVTDRLELDLDEIGRMVIESEAGNDHAKRDEALRKANQSLSDLLEKLGVATPAEARAALEEKSNATLLAKAARSELGRFAPGGISALKAERENVASTLATMTLDAVPDVSEDQAKALLDKAKGASEALAQKARARDQSRAELSQKIRDLDTELKTLGQRINEDLGALGAEETWAERQSNDRAALDKAQSDLAVAVAAADDLKKQAQGLDDLAAEKKRLEAEQSEFEARSSTLKQQRDILVGQLSELDREGIGERIDEAQGALARAKSRVAVFASQKRALDTLIEALESAESYSQRQFFAPVMRELQPLLHCVLPEAELDLKPNFSPNEIVRDGITEDFSQLSGGTKEQIAILTRLAFARFMATRGREMPVILDDALVYSDDDRIGRMFDALGEAASDIQLIVLSCRQKTFEGLRGQRLQVEDWNPE